MNEELVPGTLRALEHYLGGLGRPVAYLVILAVVLWILAGASSAVNESWINPAIQAWASESADDIRQFLLRTAISAVLIAGYTIAFFFVFGRMSRRIRASNKERTQKYEEMIERQDRVLEGQERLIQTVDEHLKLFRGIADRIVSSSQ